MGWGGSQAFLAKLKAKGKKIGGQAGHRPVIPGRLHSYWRAFTDLHKKRFWHQSGPQPISYEELQAYIGMKFRRPPGQLRKLIIFTEALDEAYLADFAKKQQDKLEASK